MHETGNVTKLTKLMLLSLLLIPFVAMINSGNVHAANVTVQMRPGCASAAGCDMGFDPTQVQVAIGDTVVWYNDDSAGHTVTSGKPGDSDAGSLFDSTKDPAGFLIKPLKSWQHTFDKAGTYPYFCKVHPFMVGTVVVGGVPEFPVNLMVITAVGLIGALVAVRLKAKDITRVK